MTLPFETTFEICVGQRNKIYCINYGILNKRTTNTVLWVKSATDLCTVERKPWRKTFEIVDWIVENRNGQKVDCAPIKLTNPRSPRMEWSETGLYVDDGH